MRVYHFVDAKYGLQNLQRRRLKISQIDRLNDPFELIGIASKDRSIRAAFERTKAELASKRGMLCFSQAWNNPVQWNHYADRHRGLCLGFEVPRVYLARVSYTEKRLVPDKALKGTYAEREAFMLQVLTTKFIHWQYEKEWRCFVGLDEDEREESTGPYFRSFSEKLALREVIIGACSNVSRREVREALGGIGSGVSLTNARLAFQTFSVVTQLNEKL